MTTASNQNAETAQYRVMHPNGVLTGYLISTWGETVTVRFSDNTVLRLTTSSGPPFESGATWKT